VDYATVAPVTAPPTPRQPDLAGVLVRIERAKQHLADFEARTRPLLAACRTAVIQEYDEQRFEYVLRIGQIPAIPQGLSAVLGDAIHNLRVSLDYLIWQLVIASGGTPSDKTAFPILTVSPTPDRHGQVRVNVNPSVPEAMQRLLREIQPFNFTHPANHQLAVLHSLDIVDKHRELLFTFIDASSVGWWGNADLATLNPGPYESGSEICRFIRSGHEYPSAAGGSQIDFRFAPMFDLCLRESAAGAWDRSIGASSLISILVKYVEGDVLPRFRDYF
jgi:hypothetical protein